MSDIYLSNYIAELFDLSSFVVCSLEGHGYAQVAGEVADTIHRIAATRGPNHPLADNAVYENEKKRIARLETFARYEKEKGHPFLFSLAYIKLWSIVEAGVNLVITELMKDPARVSMSAKIGSIKGPLIPFLESSEEERITYLKERLLQETGSTSKVGINKFEIVLEEFHLNGNVKEPIRKILIELCEIRNVLVHKCGIADSRFIEKCPWLNYEAGQRLVPNYTDFRVYSDGALWYLLELSQRMTDAYHPDEHEEVTDLLADIEKQIDSSLSARKVANSPAKRLL